MGTACRQFTVRNLFYCTGALARLERSSRSCFSKDTLLSKLVYPTKWNKIVGRTGLAYEKYLLVGIFTAGLVVIFKIAISKLLKI